MAKRPNNTCPTHNQRFYYPEYDRFACLTCDRWLDKACSCRIAGEDCPFKEAPEKPSLLPWDTEIEVLTFSDD